jgi:predicted dehydrogenase
MSDSPALSFGIIGCGRVVRELHLPAWRTVQGVRLVSVCDSSTAALKEVATAFPGVRIFTDPEELLTASGELAFVDIATPGPTHAALVQAAIKRRINVICEKPLALRALEATRLYDAAGQAAVMVTAIHNYRFKRNSEAALEALKAGALGDIVSVGVRFRAGSIFGEQTAWLRRERESRTVLFDSGIHLVDLAMLFLGPLENLRFVDSDVDDLGIQRVVFGTAHSNGSRGLFDFMIDSASASTEIEIQGEAKALNMQFFPEGVRFLPVRDNPVDRAIAESRRAYSYFKGLLGERLLRKTCHRAVSHARLFSAFTEALRSGGPNPIPPEQVLHALGILDEVAQRAYGTNASSTLLANGVVSAAALSPN